MFALSYLLERNVCVALEGTFLMVLSSVTRLKAQNVLSFAL